MIVVKAGGGEGIHYESVCDDIAELVGQHKEALLVHGGSHLTNELATALGHEPQFVTSPSGFTSRFTDERTMEIFMMAYCGQTNKSIVRGLRLRGINAIGLSGIDAGIWVGKQKSAIQVVENGRKRILRGNMTGTVDEVNDSFLRKLMSDGMLPVLCPPAISHEGVAINVDGDRAAAKTASALAADELVILSNVPGVMQDIDDESSRIETIRRDELESVSETYAKGRMKIKLLAAGAAIDAGVGSVVIADARPEHCILRALDGHGTRITA